MTTKTETLHSALASAFAAFEAASKDAKNPHFKSKYAGLPSVIDAVKPALIAHRLFFTQATHDVDGGVCVETLVHHESGESMSFGRLFVPASKNDAQGFGSALTYARRYSLMTAFGIPTEDDDGHAAARSAPAYRSSEPIPEAEPEPVKVEGIHKIKERLRAMMTAGNEPITLAAFKELKRANKDDLKAIRDANHQWWTGDGEEFEGYGPWIVRREIELDEESSVNRALQDMRETVGGLGALTTWADTNAAFIAELDGLEKEHFQREYDAFGESLELVERVNAG